jgi:predicted hydrocarbon binding protein
VRQALVAIQEVMGENGLTAVLRLAGLEQFIDNLPPDDLTPAIQASEYAQLNAAIETFYGRGGRGMLQRIGKASFQYAVREQSALLGIAGVALKLLPPKQRIRFILNGMANALKKTNPELHIEVGETDDGVVYTAHICSVCYGRHSQQPICHLYVGSIVEAVGWVTGVDHHVSETHCIAKGDPYCRFEVRDALD